MSHNGLLRLFKFLVNVLVDYPFGFRLAMYLMISDESACAELAFERKSCHPAQAIHRANGRVRCGLN
jgi:hypothetical protein